jgi:uncharacterized membrane protein YkvA (DUF1232 family)
MNEVNTKQMFSDIMGFLKKGNYDGIPEFLDKLLEEGKLTVSMLHDFLNNEYPKVPWKTIVALVGIGICIGVPLIREMKKVVFVDDLAVIYIATKLIGADLRNYRAWEESRTYTVEHVKLLTV